MSTKINSLRLLCLTLCCSLLTSEIALQSDSLACSFLLSNALAEDAAEKSLITEGDELYHTGEYAESIKRYEQVIKLNPKSDIAYYNIGSAYRELNRLKQAKEYLLKAIELDPKFAAAYNNLGLVYFAFENYPEAKINFDKAIELGIRGEATYANLGRVCIEMKLFDEAIKAYKKALRYGDKDPEVLYNYAFALEGSGDLKSALDYYQKALSLAPENPDMAEAVERLSGKAATGKRE